MQVFRIQRERIFTAEVIHAQVDVWLEDLGFWEEDQIRLEQVQEVLEREDIPLEALQVPGDGRQIG